MFLHQKTLQYFAGILIEQKMLMVLKHGLFFHYKGFQEGRVTAVQKPYVHGWGFRKREGKRGRREEKEGKVENQGKNPSRFYVDFSQIPP